MINEIIKELRKIAKAFTSLCDFKYEYISEFNGIEKEYPLLLVDKRITFPLDINQNQTDFTINLYFMDLYEIEERGKKVYEDKQTELLEIARQYLKEFVSKNSELSDYFILEEEIPCEFFDRMTIDSTFGVQATIKMKSFLECKTGSFNYE